MNSIDRLTEIFRKFPGIGPRQAKRFVYYLLTRRPEDLHTFAEEIKLLQSHIHSCELCLRFFEGGATRCPICASIGRESEMLLLVPRDVDIDAIERSGAYNGLYFVMGGELELMAASPESFIRIRELIKRIEKEPGIKEIIIAMNLTTEGEYTAEVIREKIKDITDARSITLSLPGRGFSTGIELEYSDKDTIKNALKNRFLS